MATLAATTPTLIDVAKRTDPNGKVTTKVAELLSQMNAFLTDMPFYEANNKTAHRITARTSLPTVGWRRINEGTASSKSTTAQFDEVTAMLTARSQVDKELMALYAGEERRGAFMLSEEKAFLESMSQEMAQTLLYGDYSTAPKEFNGLAPRYAAISGATYADNMITGAGSGSDNTSIWFVCWGEDTIYGLYPEGSTAGIKQTPIMDGSGDGCYDATDSNGYRFRAFGNEYMWKCGLCVKDWRYVVRICNIDVSNLIAESSAADLIKLMSRATDRVPNFSGVKPVFYVNRTVFSMLKIQALNKSNSALGFQEALGQMGGATARELTFMGFPVRMSDQILNTEATIS